MRELLRQVSAAFCNDRDNTWAEGARNTDAPREKDKGGWCENRKQHAVTPCLQPFAPKGSRYFKFHDSTSKSRARSGPRGIHTSDHRQICIADNDRSIVLAPNNQMCPGRNKPNTMYTAHLPFGWYAKWQRCEEKQRQSSGRLNSTVQHEPTQHPPFVCHRFATLPRPSHSTGTHPESQLHVHTQE